jgi:hypothetical protein
MDPSRFRRPTQGPSPAQIADRDRWEALTAASLATTQAAAEKWRTGLAAFVTLITGGLLIKGPQTAADLETPWRIAITILTGGGLLLAIAGLWMALRAAAGAPGRVGLPEIVANYGGVRQFEIASAQHASDALGWAKVITAAALSALALAVFASWWAPTVTATPRIQVSTHGTTVCGKLSSADGKQLRVQVDGEANPRVVRFDDVENLRVTTVC